MSEKASKPKSYRIKIDRGQYDVEAESLSGSELRALPEPDLGNDVDLYLESRGDEDDRKIEDSDSVEMRNGLHFFSAARTINPGAPR